MRKSLRQCPQTHAKLPYDPCSIQVCKQQRERASGNKTLGVALPPRAVTRCIVDPALCTTSEFFVKRFLFFSWTNTLNLIISNPQVCNLEYTLYFFKFFSPSISFSQATDDDVQDQNPLW